MEIKVPDIGDFSSVPVVSILVAVGDVVSAEDPLIELESDKATMEVPSPVSGTITRIDVKEGDEVSEGSVIAGIETADEVGGAKAAPAVSGTGSTAAAEPVGYGSAAGVHEELKVTVPDIGDFNDVPVVSILVAVGDKVSAEDPLIELESDKATMEVPSPAEGTVVSICVKEGDNVSEGAHIITLSTGQAAVAKAPVDVPPVAAGRPTAPMTGDVHAEVLVLGSGPGGYTAAFRAADLGLQTILVEKYPTLGGVCLNVGCIPSKALLHSAKGVTGPDGEKLISFDHEKIYLKTKVTAVSADAKGLNVTFSGPDGEHSDVFDKVLVAVGRRPNGSTLGLANCGVAVDERGFIHVDNQQRTNVPHIFAIGDVVGQPMLAHKAVHEGKVAAEVCSGMKRVFDARVIPSVAYTDPEVAWVGLTENDAKAQGIKVGKGVFPWAASGRSLSIGRSEGVTKLLFDPETDQLLGAGIVGPHAGDLIAEAGLAIEMGADATDLGQTIHPHPTLSETVNFAAEMFEGTITDLIAPKKKH